MHCDQLNTCALICATQGRPQVIRQSDRHNIESFDYHQVDKDNKTASIESHVVFLRREQKEAKMANAWVNNGRKDMDVVFHAVSIFSVYLCTRWKKLGHKFGILP